MNRRNLLVASSSSIFLGIGGCLDDQPLSDSDEETNPDDRRIEDATDDEGHETSDNDEELVPQLEAIGWLIHESSEYGQYGEHEHFNATGPAVTDPVESSGELHVLLIEHLEQDRTESALTVDLLQTDADESGEQLIYLGRAGWLIGATCFLPPVDEYQLDVQAEDDLDWELTVIDPSVFRTESSYETVSFNEHDKIQAHGGGDNVFGALRLSPGMRIKLAETNSDFPHSTEAYTESGQKEVLFDETEDEGKIVETNLDGVTWFDTTDVVEGASDGWKLEILPEL